MNYPSDTLHRENTFASSENSFSHREYIHLRLARRKTVDGVRSNCREINDLLCAVQERQFSVYAEAVGNESLSRGVLQHSDWWLTWCVCV